MSSKIYSGPSDGFESIAEGYVDYAMEVIARRSVPDVRDGLKPVARRIIYKLHENDKGYLQKCATLVGQALELHPHGDSSVYGAFALLTDENGTCNMPFFHGMGNLGHVYSSDKPAAMRYPKAMINSNADYFFRDKEVMELMPAEEGDGVEPTVLNATFPVVLVNGAMGIAVSAGTKMPSFNFDDVIDLTIKYIQNKKLDISDMIIPDYPTGGVLVCNNEEIAKIMLTGKGKLKIRAKVEIEGKDIQVIEVPYGKTAEGIVKAVNDSEIAGVSSCILTSGRGANGHVSITCKTKKVVEEVLMHLYRQNILQSTFGSNILVIEDGEPKILGVYGVVETWYPWRRQVLEKKFNKLLEGLQNEKVTLSYFIRLVQNEEWKNTYVNTYTHSGKKPADAYLHEIFEDIPPETCTWILDRALSAFFNGGSYAKRYDNLLECETTYNSYLADLDAYIIDELLKIKKENIGKYPRKTEISYTDYKFSKISDSEEVEDTSFCVYTLKKDGFLTKTREMPTGGDILCQISAQANSILIGFDNYGRILRVIGKEIPFTPLGDNGVYMPKYFDATFEESYKVLYLGLLDGKKRMLVYRDGYIGFLDTSEYYEKKNIKIVSKGVCVAVMDKLLHVYEEDEIPAQILLADDTQAKLRLGVVVTADVPERSRLSRAKVLSGSDIDTHYLKGFKDMDLVKFVEDPDAYLGKLKVFKGDFYGDPSELLDGDYLEICTDLVEVNE